jgi:hypothetical protein
VGGQGSSRWGEYYERKVAVEECFLLDIRKLKGALSELPEPSSGSLWAVRIATEEFKRVHFAVDPRGGAYGDPVVEFTYNVAKEYRPQEETHGDPLAERIDSFLKRDTLSSKVTLPVELTTTSPRFGGVRWWFACPLRREEGWVCERKISKVWMPEGQRHFGCRQCHSLTYHSSLECHALDKLIQNMAAGAPREAMRLIMEHLFRESISAMRTEARRRREHAKSVPEILREIAEEVFPDN